MPPRKSTASREVPYPKVVKVKDQATALQKLKPGCLVLVQPANKAKSLKMVCPCGCGAAVSINLLPEGGLAWRLTSDQQSNLSLWPSVWLNSGCCSHFILRHNVAYVLGDSPRSFASTWRKLSRGLFSLADDSDEIT
jgi:hypothetical protein